MPGERPEIADAESLTAIGTRALFSSEHDDFREGVRAFFADSVAPHHAEWEAQGCVSREVWGAAGDAGLLGVCVPETAGGLGADVRYAAVTWEEQAYSGCSGPGFALHSDIVLPYLTRYGSRDQVAAYVPDMLAGKAIGAIAMTEPNTGSDLQAIATKAVAADDDTFVLSGSKTYITNGFMSDVVIVVARTGEPDRRGGGLSLFLVEDGMDGFSKGSPLSKVGFKAQDTCELFFDEVKLSRSRHLLGEEGKAFAYLMGELPQERLLIADSAVASAEAAYEWTRGWVNDRVAFGQPLKGFQTVSHELARAKTEIAVARAFLDQCIALHSAGALSSQAASMAKLHATELQGRVIDTCVQLHGGYGYMTESPIARAWADARVTRIYGGANAIMTELVARTV